MDHCVLTGGLRGTSSVSYKTSLLLNNKKDKKNNTMDIGRDVLTRTLIGNTDAEKVFTPWWITLHHYLVYFLVVLGKVYFVWI